jgi:hypothetical protein
MRGVASLLVLEVLDGYNYSIHMLVRSFIVESWTYYRRPCTLDVQQIFSLLASITKVTSTGASSSRLQATNAMIYMKKLGRLPSDPLKTTINT